MRSSYKILLSFYLAALLWLLLFKFSFDITSVIEYHQTRSLNLIPFAGFSHGGIREMLDNVIVFIPLGLLIAINGKRLSFWRKFSIISAISLVVEIVQFVFAIGITDITDLITNSAGGFIGLWLYQLGTKYYGNSKFLDRSIAAVILILVTTILFLRIFVLRVRY